MEKEKLKIFRNEIVDYISDMDLNSDFSIIDRFEIMNNIDKFLNPDRYDENIRVLNKHLNS